MDSHVTVTHGFDKYINLFQDTGVPVSHLASST